MDFFQKLIPNKKANPEYTIKQLKVLIANIEKENVIEELYSKYSQIEKHLEGMSKMNYENGLNHMFNLLFRKLVLFSDLEKRKIVYINLYLQKRIFSNIDNFLNNYEAKTRTIILIHSLNNPNKRIKFYLLYTNYFKNVEHLSYRDLITIYESILRYVIIKYENLAINNIKICTQLVKEISNRYKEIINNKINIGRTGKSKYIIILIESYIDIYIMIMTKQILSF